MRLEKTNGELQQVTEVVEVQAAEAAAAAAAAAEAAEAAEAAAAATAAAKAAEAAAPPPQLSAEDAAIIDGMKSVIAATSLQVADQSELGVCLCH